MKRRLIIPIVCLMLAVNLTACKNNEDPQNRTEFPITYFTAYSTIVQTDNEAFLLVNGDSQNFRLWIDSCPIIEEVNFDISENWDFKITFCDTENIIVDDSTYYIPHTAAIHIVYINEEDSIIQFDNVAYSLRASDADTMSFYEGIRTFLITK